MEDYSSSNFLWLIHQVRAYLKIQNLQLWCYSCQSEKVDCLFQVEGEELPQVKASNLSTWGTNGVGDRQMDQCGFDRNVNFVFFGEEQGEP